MTNEEIVAEIRKIQGDVSSLYESLYIQNYGLICKAANKYSRGDEYLCQELVQESYFALFDAVNNYVPGAAKFSTYLYFHLKRTMLTYIYKTTTAATFPSNTIMKIQRYIKLVDEYAKLYGKNPSDPELISGLDLADKKELRELKKCVRLYNCASLDAPTNEEGITLADTVEDENIHIEENITDQIQNEELAKVLDEVINEVLTESQIKVINDVYYKGSTLKESADNMGITPEIARTHRDKALRNIRNNSKGMKKLKPYISHYRAYSEGLNFTSLEYFKNTGLSSQERIILNTYGNMC